MAGILPLQPNAQQVSASSIISQVLCLNSHARLKPRAQTLISVVKTSGISTYKINGVSDYVLPKGSKASIVYSTSTTGFIKSSNGVEGVGYASALQNTNQSYNLSFYHQSQVNENYTFSSKYYKPVKEVQTLRQHTTVGTVCKYQSSKTKPQIQMSTLSSSHILAFLPTYLRPKQATECNNKHNINSAARNLLDYIRGHSM